MGGGGDARRCIEGDLKMPRGSRWLGWTAERFVEEGNLRNVVAIREVNWVIVLG